MRGFKDIGSKGHFSAKKGGFRAKTPLGGKLVFFKKNPLGTFFQSRQDATLCQVSEKSDARIFRYRLAHARTHERESIGPSAIAERPKKRKTVDMFFVENKWKYGKN